MNRARERTLGAGALLTILTCIAVTLPSARAQRFEQMPLSLYSASIYPRLKGVNPKDLLPIWIGLRRLDQSPRIGLPYVVVNYSFYLVGKKDPRRVPLRISLQKDDSTAKPETVNGIPVGMGRVTDPTAKREILVRIEETTERQMNAFLSKYVQKSSPEYNRLRTLIKNGFGSPQMPSTSFEVVNPYQAGLYLQIDLSNRALQRKY